MTHRPHMPLRTKLDAAILQLGLDPACVEFDHDPALGLRAFDPETKTYTPDANDPRYITVRTAASHAVKTNGTKATTAGSDKNRIAKVKRLDELRAEMQRILLKPCGQKRARRGKIPSRHFPKGRGFAKRRDA